MTDPVCNPTHREKLYSHVDDEPNVCRSKEEKPASARDTPSDPQEVIEAAIDQNERRPGKFGAFASPSAADGARGAGSGPPGPPRPESSEPIPCTEGRGPGIAIGVGAGVVLGAGPGIHLGAEGGVILHRNGISGYLSTSKVPTHCETPSGDPEPCTRAVGAAAGAGVVVHLVPDADKVAGDGRTVSFESPAVSGGANVNEDTLTSVHLGVGPTVGAAMHVSHSETEMGDLSRRQPICEAQ